MVVLVLAGFVMNPAMALAQQTPEEQTEAPATDDTSACPARPLDTNIHVKLDLPEPKIDHSMSRYDLRDFNVSTKSPYGKGNFTHVNGLMQGPVELGTKITIAWQTDSEKKENCFWYRTVNLVLRLQPIIYVASEVPAGKCYYNAIIEHEMKHVEVDRGLVRDYQNIVYDSIENFIQENGTIDHVPTGQEKEAQRELSKALEAQIRQIHLRMREDRISRQAQVDNLKEYDRVANECSIMEKLER
ncbi:MAG TPA: hypothetical protein VGF14_00845 [Alphaproteobacteria bacterium]